MIGFEQEMDGIYRLKVPFDRIYTSVFLLRTEDAAVLVDCATTPSDVTNIILPALKALGCPTSDLKALVLTHRHNDHAGGLDTLLQHVPHIRVVTDVCSIAPMLVTYPLAGHTADSIGVLDMRTGTLLSGDSLQGAGVDCYRCAIKYPSSYLETLDRIKHDKRIESILFSHAYEPWYRDSVRGRAAVEACLCDCLRYVNIKKGD